MISDRQSHTSLYSGPMLEMRHYNHNVGLSMLEGALLHYMQHVYLVFARDGKDLPVAQALQMHQNVAPYDAG